VLVVAFSKKFHILHTSSINLAPQAFPKVLLGIQIRQCKVSYPLQQIETRLSSTNAWKLRKKKSNNWKQPFKNVSVKFKNDYYCKLV